MAEDKDLVRFVQYVFRATDLSLNLSDLSRYHIHESVQNYISLCEEELQQTYPQAVIVVLDNDSTASTMETYVETLDNFEETPDPDEIEVVEEICRRLFEQRLGDWAVLKKFVSIKLAKDHIKIPLSVIRWVCANGLSEGASKSSGLWELLSDNVSKISELVEFVNSQECLDDLSVQAPAVIACDLGDMKDISVIAIPEYTKFLVISVSGFSKVLFKPDTSLILLYRVGHQVEVEVEHFVDGVGWSDSQWRYPIYAEALASQAQRKDIDSEMQSVERNGKQDIDGISFRLSKNVSQEMTIGNLVAGILLTLTEVVGDAELSLVGGPVWDDNNDDDEIYQKDERRFCEEVLTKLLEKMGFSVVRYIHGGDEYGRDFIFEEKTPFFRSRYYGLQAKAGNISGRAKSKIDLILSQIEDAFAMPYAKEPGRPNICIDTMIIAISGEFSPTLLSSIA